VALNDDEPATPEIEKRKYRRAKLITQVKCEALGRENVMVTRDVSLGGIFVNDRDPFPANSEVSLAFRLSPTAPLLTCNGRVAYAIRGVGMGVMFTEISDDVRQALKEFVDAAH
jgi:hypothetical protein